MDDEILRKLTLAIADIDFDNTTKLCREAVTAGISPTKVVEALSDGMLVIGEKFEASEFFLSELIMAGEIMKEAQEIINPYYNVDQAEKKGRVVMGTVEGDLHDIGKNIVISLLSSVGFEVTDLGVNVPKENFIQAVRELEPDVLGLSALLRATVSEMGNVIQALEEAGIREEVKVVVGGLPLNEEYAKSLGADYYAEDAWKGVEIIKRVVEED